MEDGKGAADLGGAVAAILAALEAEEGAMTDKKRRVVEAAILCFAERGYAATPTSAIARRAGVAEGTIFRHFATKKDLLIRIVRPLFAHSLLPLAQDEMRTEGERAGGDLAAMMKAIMLNRLAFADRYAPLVRILIQELPFHAELREAIDASVPAAMLEQARRILAPLVESGAIRPIEPARFVRAIVSQVMGYYLMRTFIAPGAGWDDAAEIEAIVDLVLNGLRPR